MARIPCKPKLDLFFNGAYYLTEIEVVKTYEDECIQQILLHLLNKFPNECDVCNKLIINVQAEERKCYPTFSSSETSTILYDGGSSSSST